MNLKPRCASDQLTTRGYWDEAWANVKLPMIVERDKSNAIETAIVDVFDRFFPRDQSISVLELGGAPGGFLAYCAREYGCQAHALDYSEVGCRLTVENFRQLDLPVTVHQQDLFDASKRMPQFDIVYSLGLIEHFQDTKRVIDHHWQLVKPGGLLFLGVPHFVHVFWPILHILAPNVAHGHNRDTLVLERWTPWESSLRMNALHKAYIGGLDPILVRSVLEEERRLYSSPWPLFRGSASFILQCFGILRHHACRVFPGLRTLASFNGPSFSAYGIGVYRK